MLSCRNDQERIDPLEKEAEIIKEMYDLIDAYKVPTPPEDFAVYQVSRCSGLEFMDVHVILSLSITLIA